MPRFMQGGIATKTGLTAAPERFVAMTCAYFRPVNESAASKYVRVSDVRFFKMKRVCVAMDFVNFFAILRADGPRKNTIQLVQFDDSIVIELARSADLAGLARETEPKQTS